mgnify:CR=1 FL=1
MLPVLMLLVLLFFGTDSCCCLSQGLPGIPDAVRSGSKFPPLIPGKTDSERWALLTRNEKRLIGMKHKDVIKLFGAGATPETTKELVYQLTSKPPEKTKNIAYLELSIHLDNDTVTRFAIDAVMH